MTAPPKGWVVRGAVYGCLLYAVALAVGAGLVVFLLGRPW